MFDKFLMVVTVLLILFFGFLFIKVYGTPDNPPFTKVSAFFVEEFNKGIN